MCCKALCKTLSKGLCETYYKTLEMSYLAHPTVDERATHSPGPSAGFASPINFDGSSSETDNTIGDNNSFITTSGVGSGNQGDPMAIDAEGYVCHHIPSVPSATLTPTQYTPISTSPGPVLFCPHHSVPVNVCSPALVPEHDFSPTPFGEEHSAPYPSTQPTMASNRLNDAYYTNSPAPSGSHAMTGQRYSGPINHHLSMNASSRRLGHSSSFHRSTASHSHDSPPFRGRGRGRDRSRGRGRSRGGRQPHTPRGHSFRGRSPRGRSPRGCTATDGQFPSAYQNHPQPPYGRGRTTHSYKNNSRRGHYPRHNQGPTDPTNNFNSYSNQSGPVSSFGAGSFGPAIPTNNYPPGYQTSVSVFSVPRIHRSMHSELSDYSRAILSCIPPRLTPPAQRHSQQPSSEEQRPKHHLPEDPNSDASTYTAAMRLVSLVSRGILDEIERRSNKKNPRFSRRAIHA